MPKLTLSMIVKNEEQFLPGCLESVQGIADEIVVVDTGSTDSTKRIAEEHGAKVYDFVWVDDFSAARNFALQKSTGNWILYLDADERLTESSVEELKEIIEKDKNLAVNCLIDCIDNHNNKASVIKYTRLFRNNPKLKFKGKVHEQIVTSLKELNYKTVESNIKILHLGYDIPKAELEKKAERNLALLLKEFAEKPTIYAAFQIAQSYGVLDDSTNVIKYFDYILSTKESPKLYKAHAYRYKAAKAFERGDFKIALNLASKGNRLDPDQPLLNMLLAKIYLLTGQMEESLKFIFRAYQTNKSETVKEFELVIDPRSVLYLALQISSAAKSAEHFNYYFSELKKLDSGELSSNKLLNFVRLLFNGEPIEENSIKDYASQITEANCELLFSLIEKYPLLDIKLRLLNLSSDTLSEHTAYLNSYGYALLQNNATAEAAEVFEKSIKKKITEPAIIFYLISAYVQLEQYEKITALVELAEKSFAALPEVMERLNMLKEKLSVLN
ncbi:MAG: glycosyltransferase [Ignavibacteriae bacterium]|nr:glycosyltransferase [Ignavibacteriota bacterium]NOG97108.1 glycosyltransferase [Ignavibacteriota bacterium]